MNSSSHEADVLKGDPDEGGRTDNPLSHPRPNIKAMTNKQRNWFSSFEKGKTAENVDSSR
jgi:hypothetical protein